MVELRGLLAREYPESIWGLCPEGIPREVFAPVHGHPRSVHFAFYEPVHDMALTTLFDKMHELEHKTQGRIQYYRLDAVEIASTRLMTVSGSLFVYP